MDADLEFDETFDDGEIEPDEAPPGRRNPLRIILLILFVLMLLCVVCIFGLRFLGSTGFIPVNSLPAPVQSFLAVEEEPPPPPPAIDTPIPEPVTTEELPLPETSEAVPTEEPPPPDTGELPATTEPTEEPIGPAEEPTQELVEAPAGEATPTTTTAPVPGPTSTSTPPSDTTPEAGPTVAVTAISCDNNTPPTAKANGPYTAMMGKGQTFVTFDATGSSDSDGVIIKYEWDFGDDSKPGSGESVTHNYTEIDSYVAILTVTDDCNATGQDVAEVSIVGPTPPANGDNNTPTPTPPPPPSGEATMGFCYLVQRGDTLAGVAWYYRISLQDLAAVNGVSTGYLVIAGQGLFIPSGEITDGPNAYLVQAGDTLNSIAYHCGLTITTLAETNGLDTNAELVPGQTVTIPRWIDQ